jgi:transcriptional regulator with XRE-family HTH domain
MRLQLLAPSRTVVVMVTGKVKDLGDYIREQRQSSSISLRQLARLAGVSNPYLSQIERGLRKPSAEILQQIAKALRISAEALYVQAGILEERDSDTDVPGALLRDEWVTERQKQVLLEIYDSFRKENEGQRQSPEVEDEVEAEVEPVAATPAKPAAPPAPAKKATKPARKRAPQPVENDG